MQRPHHRPASRKPKQRPLCVRRERGEGRKEKELEKLEKVKAPAPTHFLESRREPAAREAVLGGAVCVYLWNDLLLFDTFTFPVKILKMVL